MIDSKVSLVVFTVLFSVVTGTVASQFQVDGINCGDASNLITEPADNATEIDTIVDATVGIKDVFFGCSSTNPIINGVFVSMQAALILVLLFVFKDLVPFT